MVQPALKEWGCFWRLVMVATMGPSASVFARAAIHSAPGAGPVTTSTGATLISWWYTHQAPPMFERLQHDMIEDDLDLFRRVVAGASLERYHAAAVTVLDGAGAGAPPPR